MDDILRRPRRPKVIVDENGAALAEMPVAAKQESIPTGEPPEDIQQDPEEPSGMHNQEKQPNPKKKISFKFKVPTPKTKRQWVIAGFVIAFILTGTVLAVYRTIFHKKETPVVQQQEPEPEPLPEPEPIYSIVSGRELTDKTINNRPIYAVQIENSPEARPQSGLKDADIISEAIAEGGITRFNAIFHDNIPANLGPVRSLRPYFIDWFLPYDAAIVHAGGSAEALQDVRNLGLKDMDSVSSIMRRISQRYSPHNYYTTGQQVLDLAMSRGYTPNVSSPLPRKKPEPAETPTAGTINLRISSTLYNVSYTWDKATNTYLRSQGGSKHIDAETGEQLAPNVVIVPVMGRRIHPDRVHNQYDTVGSGTVYVFQDGTVIEGTWSKSSRSAQWELKDSTGNPIKLNPGQTWFTMIESADRVSFQP